MHTDVIIVGGGLCGTAVGYACSLRGARVTILERETLGGSGATQHSRGIVRAYDPDPRLMSWALKGTAAWRRWGVPGPGAFHACGVVYLLAEAGAGQAAQAAARHSSTDYPIVVLDARELRARFPQLSARAHSGGSEVAGLYEPHGGYCDPRLAARLYGEAVRRNGGCVLEGTRVCAVASEGDRVCISTEAGHIHASVAVLAAGRSTMELAPYVSTFDRTIPLSCFADEGDELHFCLIDEVTGIYVRPEPPGHFYCGGAPQTNIAPGSAPPPFDDGLHEAHRAGLERLLGHPPGEIIAGVMGADGYTADLNPLLGFLPEQDRMCVATGFSGRGAKYIPAVAQWLSSAILERLRVLQ
jgi:glycine/D-amino acid oxidase-like deaminating enzyme